MELKGMHIAGGIGGLIVIGISFLFTGSPLFLFILGLGVLVTAFPFVISTIQQTTSSTEKEEMFLEFARNLVESVKTGTPISKSIINVSKRNYGALTPHVKKLSNQIKLGIPLNLAIKTFAKDVNNKTVSRALTLIGQAERAGGDIGIILESVAKAVSSSDKLKKERKATIQTLVVQGYIIFFVFIIIILVMQFRIIPMLAGIGGELGGALGFAGGESIDANEISNAFLYLLLIQGFFTGLTIGKLSENNIKAGFRHSFSLMFMSFIISAGANAIFGGVA